ncbi:alpha/beta fold hydrolase [Pseudorhodobacter sp. W20_MBD10_FR17]|uniref:alpha/beta fold hydrolase n=1 Tax=Pseudorhodobacter sp. W20_MBD10_FR17 TaxID=3240266 RepID=UPI003F9ABF3D
MTLKTLQLSDGRKVVLRDEGAGPGVLLIHGVGMCADAWGPQMADLARDFRVIAVNMPGHAGSDLLAPSARLPDFVRWGAMVIEALGLGPVSVAGHSMGALIAVGLAVERPDLVARLAVLNGVHRRTVEARAAVEARASEIANGKGDIIQPLSRWFEADAAQQALRAQVAQWLGNMDQAGYAAAYRAFAEGDDVYADEWGKISCPTLVLTGDGDLNSTAEMTRTMASAAPKAKAVVIQGHRHMVNLTAPKRVTQALKEWLDFKEVSA